MKLYGRFYGTTSKRPTAKAIYTQSNSRGRAPRLDLIMRGNSLQPFIHDAILVVVHRRRLTRFHIFVKNHRLLPRNNIIERWNNANRWHGDIVVMRKGKEMDLVSLCGKKDATLADFAVRK